MKVARLERAANLLDKGMVQRKWE